MKLNIHKFGRKLLVSATITIALVALSGVSAQATPSDNATILQNVNAYRAAVNAAAVSEDSNLDQLAQARADEAARTGIIQHDMNYWYNNLGPSVNSFGEVLAQNLNAAGVASAWYRSGSHYPIMVDSAYTKVGIGFATSDQGQQFAVMVLTQPSSSALAAPAPDVPQNVTASYGQGTITATWTASASGTPSNYLAYLYSDGQQVSTSFVPASSTSTSFLNVALGKNYSITVQAFRNSDGRASVESSPSASVLAPAKVADAPTVYPIGSSINTLAFSWTAPNANGASISGYILRILRDGQAVEEHTLATPYYTYAPQVSGEYSFAVAAVNAAGTGLFTLSQSRTFAIAEQQQALVDVPRQPANIKLAKLGETVQASWNAPSSSVVSSYVVSIYLNESLQQQVETAGTSYSVSIPASGSGVLRFAVIAKNAAGSSAASGISFNYANVSTPQLASPETTAPSTPAVTVPAVTSQPSTSAVTVPAVTPQPSTSAVTVPAVTPQPSTIIVANPKSTLPNAMAKPSLIAKAHGSLLVRWIAAKASGAKVIKYQVRAVSGTTTKVYTTAASARTVTVKGLPAQKLANVWVRAYSASGWGAYSGFKSVKTKR